MSMNKFDLTGKVALVTGGGANGGLGHAMAVGLAGAGADVVVSDIDAEGARQTCQEIRTLGRRSLAVTCDNARREDIAALFAELDRAFGRIDILISNVGAGARYRPEDLPYDDWERVLTISLSSSFLCNVEAGKRMMAQGTGGSIINVSSIASMHALGRGNLPHGVAKAGINAMTRDLAVEWGPHGIRVNAILPATIRTPVVEYDRADDGLGFRRLGTAFADRPAVRPAGRAGRSGRTGNLSGLGRLRIRHRASLSRRRRQPGP